MHEHDVDKSMCAEWRRDEHAGVEELDNYIH